MTLAPPAPEDLYDVINERYERGSKQKGQFRLRVKDQDLYVDAAALNLHDFYAGSVLSRVSFEY